VKEGKAPSMILPLPLDKGIGLPKKLKTLGLINKTEDKGIEERSNG